MDTIRVYNYNIDTPSARFNQIKPWAEEDNTTTAIDLENKKHLLKSEKRLQIFNDIFENNRFEDDFKQTLLQGLGTSVIPILLICPFTLIPNHNVFEEPEYWFEFPIIILIIYMPQVVAYIVMNCSYWMNISYIQNSRHFLFIGLLGVFDVFILYSVGFIVWTIILEYQYPIPFNSALNCYLTIISFYIALWFRFPIEWRKNKEFRSRLKWFIVAITFNQIITLQYSVIARLLIVFKDRYQWIIAIFLPFIREFNGWTNIKLAQRCCRGDKESVFITCTYSVSTRHSIFLAYVIGARATAKTSYLVLAEDFLINVYICIKLIWIRKRKSMDLRKQIELVQELLINELVEFLVPLEFVICLMIAYYGPNVGIIGDVGNNYWQYIAIEDINHTLTTIFTLFFIDICSLLACSFLLWRFCRINLFRVYVILQREFGVVFLVNLVFVLTSVRYSLLKSVLSIINNHRVNKIFS